MGKVAFIGGGGVRTPLVVFGINESMRQIGINEIALYDLDLERARWMAELGQAVVRREGGRLVVKATASLEDAVEGADFVLSSIRVGGIEARTKDERIAVMHGYPGQETTGPAGMAMALRTLPIALEQARLVHKLAPEAWLINFTNPAGLITQAIMHHTEARVVGICDTPSEMLHRIACALGANHEEVRCEYLGLNHLGWIRRIELLGRDVTDRVLSDDQLLDRLYPFPIFDHELIRSLRLIPSEYLLFYYSRGRVLRNQLAQHTTRGEEVGRLNDELFDKLGALLTTGDSEGALAVYIQYLNARSGSYMKLESSSENLSSLSAGPEEDPSRAATGYHRVALDVMKGLRGNEYRRVIVNIRNLGAIEGVGADDVVEVPCKIGNNTIIPEQCGPLPAPVRGLVLAVKEYERATIEAAISKSTMTARKAMLVHPAIGEWEPSESLLSDLRAI